MSGNNPFNDKTFVIGLLVGGLITGMFLHVRQKPKDPENLPITAFLPDTSGAPETPPAILPSDQPPGATASKGPLAPKERRPWLEQVRSQKEPRNGVPKRYSATARRLVAAARENEERYRLLGEKYTKKHQVIREYGREWMSHRDLRRLNNDWFTYRDPIRFAFGAARSKNFHKIMTKYAAKKEFYSFLMEAITTAPPPLTESFAGYIATDPKAKQLTNDFGKSMGLPPGTLPGTEKRR